MSRNQNQNQDQDQDHEQYYTATVFNNLSSLILNLMYRMRPPPSLPPMSPVGFASLLLGMSLSMMLCGSVTFFIGFMLIPSLIGLFVLFYFVGIVCSLSIFGRALLGVGLSSFSSKDDHVPVWKQYW